MEKQHLSVRDEIGFSSSLSHQDRVILHIFIDSFADLLHSSKGLEYVFFINTGIGSGCKIELPFFKFFADSVSREKSSNQLFDWLHWREVIT